LSLNFRKQETSRGNRGDKWGKGNRGKNGKMEEEE
jgi:hypothetical protein